MRLSSGWSGPEGPGYDAGSDHVQEGGWHNYAGEYGRTLFFNLAGFHDSLHGTLRSIFTYAVARLLKHTQGARVIGKNPFWVTVLSPEQA